MIGWSSRLHDDYRTCVRNLQNIPQINIENPNEPLGVDAPPLVGGGGPHSGGG